MNLTKAIVLILSLASLIHLASCKKTNDAPYSTFYINGYSFATNNVSAEQGIRSPRSIFWSNDEWCSFNISFNSGGFPSTGHYPIADPSTQDNPAYVGMSFRYKGNDYLMLGGENGALDATVVDGKTQYTLQDCWFASNTNNGERILFHGVFIVP